jgi:hypothetical protein
MSKEIFIHEIKLEDKDEFSHRFNLVGYWYERAQKLDTKEAWDDFISAKYALEQGLPMSEPIIDEQNPDNQKTHQP